jgi:hypothetical protein
MKEAGWKGGRVGVWELVGREIKMGLGRIRGRQEGVIYTYLYRVAEDVGFALSSLTH